MSCQDLVLAKDVKEKGDFELAKKLQEEEEYKEEFRTFFEESKTGWDSRGYWWEEGKINRDPEFYEKHYQCAIKYMNSKTKREFAEYHIFTYKDRQKFAIHRFLWLLKQNEHFQVRRFGEGFMQSSKIPFGEALLKLHGMKLKRKDVTQFTKGNKKIAQIVVDLWDAARSPYGL